MIFLVSLLFTHLSFQEATNLGDITEVPLETKFIFILLGPPGDLCMCAEIARCLGALFTDEVLLHVYTSHNSVRTKGFINILA